MRFPWALVLVFYALFDLLSTILPMGCFHTGLFFDAEQFWNQISLKDGYDPRTSLIEFPILLIIRFVLLIRGLQLIRRRESTPLFTHLISTAFILTCSFVLIKFLCFSELPHQLEFAGLWMSLVLGLLASLAHFLLWNFYIQGMVLRDIHSYTEMQSEESTDSAGSEAVERKSALSQLFGLFAYARRNGRYFLCGLVFLAVSSIARIFIPYYTGEVIAQVVKAEEGKVTQLIITMAILIFVSSFFGGLKGGCFTYATELVDVSLRKDVFASIVRQEMGFFDKTPTGELISRLTSDCERVAMVVSNNISVLLRNLLVLFGSLSFMMALSWRLTVVTFIVIPPLGFVTKLYGHYYDRLAERTQSTVAEANRHAEEVIAAMRTVRSFATEEPEIYRFDKRLREILRMTRKRAFADVAYAWINDFAENLVLLAILFYAAHLAVRGWLTVNQITSFLLYQMQLGEFLNYLFTGLMDGVGASRKIFEYLNREPAIKNDGKETAEISGDLAFEDVTFAYPTREKSNVLENLSLQVARGQTVAIVGPSGAGKSSIVQLMEHFYEPAEGRVLLDGRPVADYAHTHLHTRVAMVGQEPVLFAGTVRENILYGVEGEAADLESRMIEAAKLANAHDFVSGLANGYETVCGERGAQMSGGQKQRIAIARALVRRPAVLILDEATSALDSESEHIIQQAFQKCAVGRTVVVVAHRLSTVEKADLILVLNEGKIVERGTHSELLGAEGGLYRQLVQRQLTNT